MNALVARIAFEYPLDQTTLFDGVQSVESGSIETWKLTDDGVQLEQKVRWIDSYESNPQKSWNPAEDASILLESLTRSAADRLMSDVPWELFSGGLDSAMVAAISHEASRRTGYPLPACWTVAESEDNPD